LLDEAPNDDDSRAGILDSTSNEDEPTTTSMRIQTISTVTVTAITPDNFRWI